MLFGDLWRNSDPKPYTLKAGLKARGGGLLPCCLIIGDCWGLGSWDGNPWSLNLVRLGGLLKQGFLMRVYTAVLFVVREDSVEVYR